MSFGDEGCFSINYNNDGDETQDVDFTSLEEAMTEARRLVAEDEYDAVSVWEYGSYAVGKSEKEGYVLIWHHPETDEELQGIRGRGARVTDKGKVVPISYTPTQAPDDEEEDEAEEQEDDYVEVHCEECGKIIPMNQATEYKYEEEVGRSSGTSRSGSSSTRRQGKRGYSTTQSSSRGYSSGRTYYRQKSKLLCEECYSAASTGDWIWLAMKWGFYIIAGSIILYLGVRHG